MAPQRGVRMSAPDSCAPASSVQSFTAFRARDPRLSQSQLNDRQRSRAQSDIPRTLPPMSTSARPSIQLQGSKAPRTPVRDSFDPPAGRFGNFFGWKSSPRSMRSPSPSPSAEQSNMAEAEMQHATDGATQWQWGKSDVSAEQVHELEEELAQVSSELASSVRREMELEDELERLRAELPGARRSSDYFSDSGVSLSKFPVSDVDAKLEDMEAKLRKAEQRRAELAAEMASRTQEELARRRELEITSRRLQEQLLASDRLMETEALLTDRRRRLTEERLAKDNIGDLYHATRAELERLQIERDHMNEALTELNSRMAGLEAENARLQQEKRSEGSVESLKDVEDQRDALQRALKLLIQRYERQERLAPKPDAAPRPRKAYHSEVALLKEDVTRLRGRSEDVLEQKYQFEQNLGGAKMDLDRAEQESRRLRSSLRQEVNSEVVQGTEELHITAASWRRASATPGLEQRAQRVDELVDRLEQQTREHRRRHDRLTWALEEGEREQERSTRQMEDTQRRLADLENAVVSGQQHCEDTLALHEGEARRLDEAKVPQLQRLALSSSSSSRNPPAQLDGVLKRPVKNLRQAAETATLERRILELEAALHQAEEEVSWVVERVNRRQANVAELAAQREESAEAVKELRRLIISERENVDLEL
ncbi:hypothetical protein K470DRAFT_268799 [Piedraia hortae CBS 480.64]|uniref:DUF7603 domain-containing protein n=1 Tax=Piedraia hortae CBS 480.64 TaxID=1314780 RepID=A0A6A7C646_9PEZI|nr:hypothetical protein K470DRAFT_268799 [Piedraia hortae CBS 480.64]